MEAPIETGYPRRHAPTDSAAMQTLRQRLSSFALGMCIATLMIALVTATDTPYLNEFLYGSGSEEGILSLVFLIVSSLAWGIYLGTLTMEPVMLPAWEQSSRMMCFVWTLLLRILWVLVCRIGPLGSAFLSGVRHPYRGPEEATGLRSIANPDVPPRFIHRWLAATSPQLLYH